MNPRRAIGTFRGSASFYAAAAEMRIQAIVMRQQSSLYDALGAISH
jgi:hypothetical protein